MFRFFFRSAKELLSLKFYKISTLFLLFTFSHEAHAEKFSGWLAEWDSPKTIESTLKNVHNLDTIWMQNLLLAQDAQSVTFTETEAMKALRKAVRSPMTRIGPVLHNATEKGFDAQLGMRLLKKPDAVLKRLRELSKKEGWTALNIDLESLDPEAAELFEKFLDNCVATLKGLDVRISVSLHAKTGPHSGFEGNKFQRWDKIAQKPVDAVVMAYDYTWSQSEPGPTAPSHWIENVTTYASSIFKEYRLILALPTYGYHWKKLTSTINATTAKQDKVKDPPHSKVSWQGTAKLGVELMETIRTDKEWKIRSNTALADGVFYWKGDGEAIAFDTPESLSTKLKMIRKKGIKTPIAFWRLGGDNADFHSSWGALK
jgi:spore germination protein YaaH